ncbi:DUF1304 domain-containing protein [Calidifontibacter terrae]
MLITGLVLAALAALLHVYIWVLESLRWTTPGARAVFGTTPEQAEQTKELAYNQGFYNLFLAIEVAAGIVAYALGHHDIAETLALVGVGSMLAAASVLFLSSPDKRSAAVRQGGAPLLAVIALLVAIL